MQQSTPTKPSTSELQRAWFECYQVARALALRERELRK